MDRVRQRAPRASLPCAPKVGSFHSVGAARSRRRRASIHWATGPDVNYTHCAPLAQSFDGGTEVSVARLAAHQQRSDTTRRMLQPCSPRRHSLRKVAKHGSYQPAQKIERSLAQIQTAIAGFRNQNVNLYTTRPPETHPLCSLGSAKQC